MSRLTVKITGINRNFGFTLIEVAIVMVIIGLALAASIAPLSSQIERGKVAETEVILNDIMEALYGHAASRGRLPCPTDANSGGLAVPADGVCQPGGGNAVSGFIPGNTLGLSGKYSDEGLLLDAWGNPIRYSVTNSNASAFTTGTQIQVLGPAALTPNLNICNTSIGATNTVCAANTAVAANAVAVVISLGKDGARAVQGGALPGADQQENSSERSLPDGPAPGTLLYRVGGAANLVFVSRTPSTATGANPGGVFDDQVKWISPFSLYARMFESGQLP